MRFTLLTLNCWLTVAYTSTDFNSRDSNTVSSDWIRDVWPRMLFARTFISTLNVKREKLCERPNISPFRLDAHTRHAHTDTHTYTRDAFPFSIYPRLALFYLFIYVLSFVLFWRFIALRWYSFRVVFFSRTFHTKPFGKVGYAPIKPVPREVNRKQTFITCAK